YTFTTGTGGEDNGIAIFDGSTPGQIVKLAQAGYSYYVKVTGDGKEGQQSNITVLADVAANLETVSGTPQSATVATSLTNPFKVKVTDIYNNPVASTSVTFATSTTPANLTIQPYFSATTTITNASGTAETTFTLGDKIGAYTVTASSAGLTGSPQTFTATATADVPDSLIITPTAGSATTTVSADIATTTITATVYDQYDNVVNGTQVNYGINDYGIANTGTGENIPTPGITNASGTSQVVFTTSHTAGDNYTITADTTLGSASSTSGVIEVDNGIAHHYNIDTTISGQIAGIPFSAQVSVRDVYENLVDNFAGTSTISIASSTSAAPGIAPDGTVPVYPVSHTWNGAEYVYEFTGITLYKAETNRKIAVNDSGSLISDDSNNFNISFATGTAYLVTPNTAQNIRAGYSQAITGRLVDDYENEVKTSGVSVDLSVTNASGTPGIITPASATTDSNGRIGISPAINYAVSTTTGHSATITLNSAAPLASGTSSVITTIPGDIDHFGLTDYPLTVVAGDLFSITATAYDAYDNIKTDYDGGVWFTSTDGEPYPAVLPCSETSKYIFDPSENGTHIFANNFALKNIVTHRIQIHYNPEGGETGDITVIPDTAVKLFILDPAFSSQAGTSTTRTLSILDEFDNPATSTAPVTANLSSDSAGTYHFYQTGTTNIITSIDIPVGATSTTVDYYDEKTGTPIITAQDNAAVLTSDTQQETITPAGLGSFDITNEPASVIAGQAFGLTVTAYDLFGNLKTNYAG
ncbi:hypothetical protein KJ628_06185, partial [Patescibacteria group bacterium]|nr:hypothetical protein [Patescibacteria group bacterium]